MNEEKTKSILKYLQKNPLSTINQISCNSIDLRINHSTAIKIVNDLLRQGKITHLLEHYFVLPTIEKEINFLKKISDLDKILKPKFKKIRYLYRGSKEPTFEQILLQFISIIHLMIKIRLLELGQSAKHDTLSAQEMKKISSYLKKHLDSFTGNTNSSWEFRQQLETYLDNEHFKLNLIYEEKRKGSIPLEEKIRMTSKWLTGNNISDISKQYGYKSNKFPRRVILEKMFARKTKNLRLDEMYNAIKTGKISNEEASKVFTQWIIRINAKKLKTKQDQKRFSKTIKKEYGGWDIFDQGDFKSFDIS